MTGSGHSKSPSPRGSHWLYRIFPKPHSRSGQSPPPKNIHEGDIILEGSMCELKVCLREKRLEINKKPLWFLDHFKFIREYGGGTIKQEDCQKKFYRPSSAVLRLHKEIPLIFPWNNKPSRTTVELFFKFVVLVAVFEFSFVISHEQYSYIHRIVTISLMAQIHNFVCFNHPTKFDMILFGCIFDKDQVL